VLLLYLLTKNTTLPFTLPSTTFNFRVPLMLQIKMSIWCYHENNWFLKNFVWSSQLFLFLFVKIWWSFSQIYRKFMFRKIWEVAWNEINFKLFLCSSKMFHKEEEKKNVCEQTPRYFKRVADWEVEQKINKKQLWLLRYFAMIGSNLSKTYWLKLFKIIN